MEGYLEVLVGLGVIFGSPRGFTEGYLGVIGGPRRNFWESQRFHRRIFGSPGGRGIQGGIFGSLRGFTEGILGVLEGSRSDF